MAKTKKRLTGKAKKYMKLKELGKRSYERADALLAEIVKTANPGDEIPLSADGRKAVLVDRFAESDLVWAHAAARRYELKVIEAAAHE